MSRKLVALSLLLAIALLGTVNASEMPISIAEGADGPNRYLIIVDTSPGSDEIEIEFSDNKDDGQLAEMTVKIKVNVDADDDLGLPTADEEIKVPAGQFEDVAILVRGWEGMDTCVVRSKHVDFPEAFLMLFEGGDQMDVFDASDCTSVCRAWGNDGDDILIGGTANDELSGGDGMDYIEGGRGNDELTGGWDDFADELVGGEGADLVGKNVYIAIAIGNGSFNYELIHEENYVDFEPGIDEIIFVELDERYNTTATWSGQSLGKQDSGGRGDSKESSYEKKADTKVSSKETTRKSLRRP